MKKRISVVMGGPSAEHEVSLSSGLEVLKNLDTGRYSARAVVITRNVDFYSCEISGQIPSMEELADPSCSGKFKGPRKATESREIWDSTDVAFLALHGDLGEDGLFQGFLETVGVSYTGSGVFASAAGMNKIASKRLFEYAGLHTPPYSIFGPAFPEITMDSIEMKHGLPCFVKCPQSGSSRLMGRAENRGNLEELLKSFSGHSSAILVESEIRGAEYSCPVLQYPCGKHSPLLPVLIQPVASAFFDYEAKYSPNACREIVPAPCEDSLTRKIQETALRAHHTLGCEGLTRTDMIHSGDRLFVLEINTLPGLTPASLAPKSFIADGGAYAQLLDILIETAYKKHRGNAAA